MGRWRGACVGVRVSSCETRGKPRLKKCAGYATRQVTTHCHTLSQNKLHCVTSTCIREATATTPGRSPWPRVNSDKVQPCPSRHATCSDASFKLVGLLRTDGHGRRRSLTACMWGTAAVPSAAPDDPMCGYREVANALSIALPLSALVGHDLLEALLLRCSRSERAKVRPCHRHVDSFGPAVPRRAAVDRLGGS
jgi:hypothetical protein